MRNILFIVPDFYPDSTGFANASRNLIRSIVKYWSQDYRLSVFTTTPLNGAEELEHIKVFRHKSPDTGQKTDARPVSDRKICCLQAADQTVSYR